MAAPAPVVEPMAAPPVAVPLEHREIDDLCVAIPAGDGDDGCDQALILTDETLSGIETPGVEYEHEDACAPAPMVAASPLVPEPAVAAPVPAKTRMPGSPHELRGRKLRLLEELTDRIARRKRGVSCHSATS